MDKLVASFKKFLEIENATFTLIEHDDAFVAIVYKVTPLSGPEYILKVCPRSSHCLREEYFLKHFKDRLPVPKVIQVIAAKDTLQAAILLEYLPGAPLKVKDIDDTIAHEMGKMLARIHQNRTPGYGDLIEPNSITKDPKPPLQTKFEESINECENQLPKDLIEKSQLYFEKHLDLLDNVDGPCIVHRDFRPGNILIQGKKITGVIDWSGARASFAEEDFCLLEHGEWKIDSMKKKSFLKGYESIRPIPNYAPLMPLLRLYRAVTFMGFAVRIGTWKDRDSVAFQKNLEFVNGLVL